LIVFFRERHRGFVRRWACGRLPSAAPRPDVQKVHGAHVAAKRQGVILGSGGDVRDGYLKASEI